MKKLSSIVFGVIVAAGSGAHATIYTVYDDFDGGLANFNATVTGAGGVATHDNWTGLSFGPTITRTDYTVERIDGGNLDPHIYTLYNSSPSRTTSGQVVSIDPWGSTPGVGGRNSGVTLTFNTPVNSIGFEVGDWSTCCQPSNLYISFDNGAPILVGSSTVDGDAYLTNGGAGVFVAAFDDSDSFSSVQFWGDGYGEVLNFGGTLHYALLDQGSLPPPSQVPEPGSLALLGLGLLGLRAIRKRQSVA